MYRASIGRRRPLFVSTLLAIFVIVLVNHVSGRKRSFLELEPEANADALKWDIQECQEPVTNIDFAPPGAKGLFTGKITLLSVSRGQMGLYHKPNLTQGEFLAERAHNLSSLNKYGSCLGLTSATDVMEWAENYRRHLGASKCDGKLSTWGPCAGFIDEGVLEDRQKGILDRRDFVMYSPTVEREVNSASGQYIGDSNYHYTATSVALNDTFTSAKSFWEGIIHASDKLTNLTAFELQEANNISFSEHHAGFIKNAFLLPRPVTIVCVCDDSLPATETLDPKHLAEDLWVKADPYGYKEPECHCHTMDARPPVTCPQLVEGVRVLELSEEGVIGSTNHTGLYENKVARDAPYLRPYVSQTGRVRCHQRPRNYSIAQKTPLHANCSRNPVLGRNRGKRRRISCGVDLQSRASLLHIRPEFGSRLLFGELDSVLETRMSKIVRYLVNGKQGMVKLVEKLNSAEDSVGISLRFDENIQQELASHPPKINRIELILLVVLPTLTVTGHFLFKIVQNVRSISSASRKRINHVLLALGDFMLESITAGFLWASTFEQNKWDYQRCTEFMIDGASFSDSRGPSIAAIGLIVTHCTKVTLRSDVLAASIASAGSLLALGLLAMELKPFFILRRKRRQEDLLGWEEVEASKREEVEGAVD